MHGNSGYLFELTLPAADETRHPTLQLGVRLTSAPSQRCGMADQFSYGYLGFQVRGGIVYYLTGAPIFDAHGKRVAGKATTAKGEAKGLEHLHLVTYTLADDLASGTYAVREVGRTNPLPSLGPNRHLTVVLTILGHCMYQDRGPIFYSNRVGFPTYVNSLAVGTDRSSLYALGRLPNGRTDLFRVRVPLE